MTEPMAEVGSEQETAELSENNETEVEVEGRDLLLKENDTDKQSSQPSVKAGNSESVETSAENNLAEVSDKADDTLTEKQVYGALLEKKTDETLLNKQTDGLVTVTMTHIDTGSDQIGGLGSPSTMLENKTASVMTHVKEPHAEDNHTKTYLNDENTGGDCSTQSSTFNPYFDGNLSGSEEEQASFLNELVSFYKKRRMVFRPPKFYGQTLNCLKLWRIVSRLGGYELVTQCRLWTEVGLTFKPPKPCTTVSWSFRTFYEKVLLEYEKHKSRTGQRKNPFIHLPSFMRFENQDGNSSILREDEQGKSIGPFKRRKPYQEHAAKVVKTLVNPRNHTNYQHHSLSSSTLFVSSHVTADSNRKTVDVADFGAPADWVKINVLQSNECYDVYVLVPGLMIGEVHVESDRTGFLIISGQPEQHDNPWGITPFKKVINFPLPIDPHHTTAVAFLHGLLFVRVPIQRRVGWHCRVEGL